MSTIFVTGSTGFIGSNLVRRLLSDGHDVHIITRKKSNRWRIEDLIPLLEEHAVDLAQSDKLKEVVQEINPEIIFHLATSSVFGGMYFSEENYINTNLLGTMNLAKACMEIEYNCFINTGSSSEYGIKKGPMKECDICEPQNVYGITKLASTLYASQFARANNKPIITLRVFSPFGPFDDPSRLITHAIRNAIENKELKLADPNAVRDFVYIEDIIDLYIKAMEIGGNYPGEVFNAGSGSQTSVKHIVERIIDLSGSKSFAKWNSIQPRPFDGIKWEADISKTTRCIGWKPKHTIDAGLSKTIQWFRDNITLYSIQCNGESM